MMTTRDPSEDRGSKIEDNDLLKDRKPSSIFNPRSSTGSLSPSRPLCRRMAYTRVKTTLLLLLACLLPISATWAQPAEPSPGVQIITADDIAQAGLARLSDLFMLLDDWHATSVEGYAFDVSANGLAAAQEAAWLVLVDGNPVDLRILNAQNLNTLPDRKSGLAGMPRPTSSAALCLKNKI